MALQANHQGRWLYLATWGLFLLFAALVMNHAFFFTMDADEAFNASIAKNWLAGYGYSSSLGVIFPFDAYISSGPGYTAVQAIPIALFGNNPDLQKPFIALVHLLLLGNVLRYLSSHIQSPLQFFAVVAFALSGWLLLDFKFWHRPAGELLSLLYFLNGTCALAVALKARQLWRAVLAGLLLAAACLTKGQALLWLAGLAIACLLHVRCDKAAVPVLAVAALAFVLPVAAWHQYQHSALQALSQVDPGLYRYGQGKDWHFFSTHGSGLYLTWEIESWRDLYRRLLSTPVLAFNKFRSIFGAYGPAAGALALLLPAAVLVAAGLAPRRDFLTQALVLALAGFLGWGFLLNNSVYTHQMLPAVWFAVLLLAWWWRSRPWPLLLLVLVNAGILVQHGVRNDEQGCLLSRDAACVHTGENPVRTSLGHALQYLQDHALPAPLANCGWYFAQDVEFALPGVNHIQDCMRLFDDAVEFDRDAFITVNKLPEQFRQTRSTEDLIKIYVNKRKNLFGENFVAPVHWRRPLEFTFVAGVYMMGNAQEQQRNVMSFLEHCHEVLYRDQFYAIQHCRFEDLQAYVNAWGGLPIFTHHWEALYYEDFMYTTKVLRKNPVHMRPY